MHYALPMRTLQRVRDLNAIDKHPRHGQRSALQALSQRFALQVFQHQIVNAVLMANIVKRANVGMFKRRDGARLALKALAEFAVRRKMLRQDLDCHHTIKAGITGAIDLSHAACARQRKQFVGA